MSNSASNPTGADVNEAEKQGQSDPLGLPEPGESTGRTNKLDLSGGQDTVTLDHLGPMVVNVDGSLSRISNWGEMSEIEKKTTLRVLGKRNKARMEALKSKDGE